MNHRYAVLFHKTPPQELLALFEDYFYSFHDQKFLLCYSFENLGAFSLLEIMHTDKSKKPWRVQVQTQYVLAVADMSNVDNVPIGFLS